MQVVTDTLSRDDACRRSMSAGKLHLQRWDRKDKCRKVALNAVRLIFWSHLIPQKKSKTDDSKNRHLIQARQNLTKTKSKYIKKPNSSINSPSLCIQYKAQRISFPVNFHGFIVRFRTPLPSACPSNPYLHLYIHIKPFPNLSLRPVNPFSYPFMLQPAISVF
ncbi:hypothetical protein DL98DRAFT_199604 [Cadophora sp. DSE1049]|nr:hypothetical protein DL98DRAFT_199604 [Cadophora sp. DSE1049]